MSTTLIRTVSIKLKINDSQSKALRDTFKTFDNRVEEMMLLLGAISGRDQIDFLTSSGEKKLREDDFKELIKKKTKRFDKNSGEIDLVQATGKPEGHRTKSCFI